MSSVVCSVLVSLLSFNRPSKVSLQKRYNSRPPRSVEVMEAVYTLMKGLPVLAACVMASADYPAIPADLTTPVQQRIAINGANGKLTLLS